MKISRVSSSDIRLHFRENRSYYFSFLMCFCLGIAIGIIVVSSNESYINLLTSQNKILYSYINGTYSISEVFWNQFFKFLLPLVLIFILSLNYYSSLLSFIFITYQSAVFIMSVSAIISLYGMSGILNFIFIMLPINLIYFAVMAFFMICVIGRSRLASRYHEFGFGFERQFLVKLLISVCFIFFLCILASLIYPLFLKSAIFIIF